MSDTVETMLISWLPFAVVMVFFALLIGKQRKFARATQSVVLERQEKMLQCFEKNLEHTERAVSDRQQMIELLTEISTKLDTRRAA